MQKPHHRSYYTYFEKRYNSFKKADIRYRLFSVLKAFNREQVNVQSLHHHFGKLKKALNCGLPGDAQDYSVPLTLSGISAWLNYDDSIVFDDGKKLWNRLFKHPGKEEEKKRLPND